jgi:radial spoke head protein 9
MLIDTGIDEHMKSISAFNCVSISIEEQIKLKTTLDQLKCDIKAEEMLFWGKILGAEKDYYIALAIYYKGFKFPKKKFYFCSSSTFSFSELPEIQSHHLNEFSKFNTYFIGNPDVILEKFSDNKNININEQIGDIFKPNLKLKNLTESDRLSFVVRTIEHDTSIVPLGGFKMLPINEIRRNDLFEGLSSDELDKIENYFHFRKIESQNKRDMIDMGKAVFDFSFLDSLSDDNLKGAWSIQTDSAKTVCNIRSLVWNGYFAYHKANTNLFGSVYIGYGIKNMDIPFMQQ